MKERTLSLTLFLSEGAVVVKAEDLVAGKIVCQLKLTDPKTVRSALRSLAKAPETAGYSLVNVLLSSGAIDRNGRTKVQRFTALYQGARAAALESALLKQQKIVPDEIVELAVVQVEQGHFEKRVSEVLTQKGELGRLQEQRLREQVQKTLASEDARLVSGYTASDYEGVARSITKDRNAELETGQFTVKKLFRSKESQRLAKLSALSASREEQPATTKDLPPTARLAPPKETTPAPRDSTPPPAYATVPMNAPGELTFAVSSTNMDAPPPPPPPPPAFSSKPVTSLGDAFDENTGELNFNRVGPYLILRKLGQGALGPVYLARRPDLTKPVALKVAPVSKQAIALERFKRAAARGRDIRQESLVQVLDAGQHEGLAVLALEYVAGETVRASLSKEPFSEARALSLLSDGLAALAAVHAAGLVHTDISPETILVVPSSSRPKAKLGELGNAIRSGERAPELSGTRETYAAPEAIAGEALDARADLYSLGLVFYEALTGALPFSNRTPEELREQKLGLTPRTLAQARPDRTFAPSVEEIAARLLARDKNQRPPTAARALRAVQEVVLPGLGGTHDTARLGAKFDAVFGEE